MKRLEGKTALITGGTTGIGYETARRFLEEGAKVAITGLDAGRLADAKKSLGGNVVALRADAGDVAAQKKLAADVAAEFGKLDVLFVNAGIGLFGPFDSFSEADFDRQIGANLKGPYFLIQAFGMPNSSLYAASKAGFLSLARTLSGELVGRGIRVNAVSPGPIATPIYGKLGLPADVVAGMAEGIRNQVPLKRFGQPVEIADTVVFLASNESRFMLGAEIIVDGGMATL
jgi:NAD(P)-dependent dehydrogenase (short-subunit alcohol dehydrogenase family)